MLATFFRRGIQSVFVLMTMVMGNSPLLAGGPRKIAVTITPTTANLTPGGTQSFTASVTGTTTTTVKWTAPTGGSINGTGNSVIYTAPSGAGTYSVIATSDADTTKKATATVTVAAPATVKAPYITISPATAIVAPGQSLALSAKVTGLSNTAVGWRRLLGHGSITATGIFTAGEYVQNCTTPTPNTYEWVEVYSLADPTVVSRMAITLPAAPSTSVTVSIPQPPQLEFVEGETATLTATVSGATDTRVEWQDSTGSCGGSGSNTNGVVSVLGAFTASNGSSSSYWGADGSTWLNLRAVSVADRNKWTYLLVRVWRIGAVVLNPGSLSGVNGTPTKKILAGSQLQLAAEVKGGGSVIWSAPNGIGTISNTGLFTAPSAPLPSHTALIRATNAANPTIFKELYIDLIEPGDVVIDQPIQAFPVLPEGKLSFTATTTGTRDGVIWSTALTSQGTLNPGTITSRGVYTAPSYLEYNEKYRDVRVTATNAKNPSKSDSRWVRVEGTLSPGVLAVTPNSWPDTYWVATYDATGYVQGGWGTDPAKFWSISGNGTIVATWFDGSHGYPCVKFKTGGVGSLTLTAHPSNELGSILVSKDVQIVATPDLGGIYSNGTNWLTVLDFGIKNVTRPDGQTTSIHRLWTKPGGRWTGRKLLGPGIAYIYSGYSAWSDTPIGTNFAVDGLSLTTDPSYKKTAEVVIGAEAAGTVEDGSSVLGPSIAYIKVGQTLQLQAAVGGTTDKAVTWSCLPGDGTVSTSGLYTAPSTPGTYTVTVARSVDSTNKFDLKIRVGTTDTVPAASVTGMYSGTVTYLDDASTGAGTLSVFSDATSTYLKGGDPKVPTYRSGGQIRGCSLPGSNGIRAVFDPQPDGGFLPFVDYPHSYYVGSWYGWAVERVAFEAPVKASGIDIEIVPNDPSLLHVNVGNTITMKALVVGSPATGVTWDAGSQQQNLTISGNTVAYKGDLTGLGTINGIPSLRLSATTVATPNKQANVEISVDPAPTNQITPATYTLNAADPIYNNPSVSYKATFPSQPSNAAYWSLEEGTMAGAITGSGYYSPGTSLGTFHVLATSQWDPTIKVRAEVTVVEWTPHASLVTNPTSITLGQPVTVSWSDVYALNTPNPKLTLTVKDSKDWTVQTLDVTGQTSYSHSPSHTTNYSLMVTSATGKTGNLNRTVSVNSSATFQSFSANPATIRVGDPVTLNAVFDGTNGQLYYFNRGYGTYYGPITSGVSVQIPAGHIALKDTQPQFYATCEDPSGNVKTSSYLTVPCTPAILQFTASPMGFLTGALGNSTLSWGINSAGLSATVSLKARTISGSETTISTGGATSWTVSPTETTTYTLSVSTTAGGESKVLTIRVGDVAALSVSPTAITLAPGATTTLTATILAIPSKNGLSWSYTDGTLSVSGPTSVTYQAPKTEGTYTVTVSSVADLTLTATATIIVKVGATGGTPPTNSTFDILSFTAGVSMLGTDHRVLSWSTLGATGISLRDSNGTDTDVTGTTSLDVIPNGSTIYTLTITDGKRYISRTVTIAGSGYAVALVPTQVVLFPGVSFKFGYTTYAPSSQVLWTFDGGSITTDGTYTAPTIPGTYTVTAALVDDPSKTSSAIVTVNPITLQITPSYLTLASGQTFGFGFQMFSYGGDTPTWSTSAGSIQQNGLFTAPLTPGMVTISLTSSKDLTVSTTATVEVKPIDLMVLPSVLWVRPQGQYQLAAGTSLGAVNWSVIEGNGGSIDANGIYTAPNEVGTFTLKATSALDSSRFATAKAIVATSGSGGNWGPGSGGGGTYSPKNFGVSVEPAMSTVDAGTYTALNATVLGSEDQSVTWSIAGDNPKASVDEQGVFTAHEPGIYSVIATSTTNATLQGSALMVVESSVHGLENTPAALDLEGYSVTVLNDGKVLLAGGQDTRIYETDPDKGYRGTAYLYDPETKAFTPTGNLGQARAGHTATLLSDGRVLIAGGMGFFKWPTDPNATVIEQPVKWGEIYNPATGLFESLPVPPDHALYPGGSMRSAHGTTGQAVVLAPNPVLGWSGGQVFMVGGPSGAQTRWPFDVFNPTTNLFDLSDIEAGAQGNDGLYQTREDGAVVALNDGRALLTGGTKTYGVNDTSPCGWSRCTLNEARVFNPQSPGALIPIAPLTQARAGHSMTKLSNGKILIIGGSDHGTHISGTIGQYLPNPTATAELFDPQDGTFTPTGSMKWARAGHAAILLPTGQVMIMGGFTSVTGDSTNQTWLYPTESELYDPDAGTFSVMDKVAFGLDRPKLALMQNGGVFVAGKPIITASAGTPAAGIQEKGSKSVRSVIAPQTLTGSGGLQEAVFGALAPSGLILDYATMNQGVERYLNPNNSPNWKPYADPKLKFKSTVPSIAGRSGLYRFTVHTTRPLTTGVAQNLKISVNTPNRFNTKTLLQLTPMDAPVFGSLGVGTRFRSEPLILGTDETVAGAKLTGELDPSNVVIPASVPSIQRLFEVDPKWAKRPTLRFRIIPIRYKDPKAITPSTPTGIDLAPPALNASILRDFTDELLRMYPVSSVEYMGSLPESEYIYDLNVASTDGGKPRAAIESTKLDPKTGLTTYPGWDMLVNEIDIKRVSERSSADDTHYIGYISNNIPNLPSTSTNPSGGQWGGWGFFSATSPIKIEFISSVVRVIPGTMQPYGSIPHEVGHNLNRLHAPTLSGPGQLIPSGQDSKYPYLYGRLGPAASFELFDAVSSQQFSTLYGNTVEYDLMGYKYPRWISDYTYEGVGVRHMELVKIARPAALLTIAALAGGQELNKADEAGAVIISFDVDNNDNIDVHNIVPIKIKHKIVPSREGSYLFKAFSVSGQSFETRFEPQNQPNPGSPKKASLDIPDPEKWIGFSIFHGKKLIFNKTFKVLPAKIANLSPISTIYKKDPMLREGQVGGHTMTIDWGGEEPDSAYVRVSWDNGINWEAINNFLQPSNPTFTIPVSILDKNPNPVVEIHGRYGFVERVNRFVWKGPGN